jgi:phage terminase large subunit
VTGDSSGRKGDVAYKSRHDTAYTLIQSYLGLSRRQMQPNKKNLEYEDSRLLMNVMVHNYPNFFIDLTNCPNLVNDCRIAKVDEDKDKPHQLKKDRQVYKMDYFDGLRYLIQMYFNEFAKIKYLRYKSQNREAA